MLHPEMVETNVGAVPAKAVIDAETQHRAYVIGCVFATHPISAFETH